MEQDATSERGHRRPSRIPLTPLRADPYGGVDGLDMDELATPEELERWVFEREFAPILALPCRGRRSGIRPGLDENGAVDWGAFATVDFDRMSGAFDRLRYKAECLKEELRDVLILFSNVKARVGRGASKVLKDVREGRLSIDEIESLDVREFVRLFRKAERLRAEIQRLREASEARTRRALDALLG